MMSVNDDGLSLNHLNVILQSLYHLCPLRKAIFNPTVSFDTATLKQNPLELIFAKMHYDYENRNGPTDASIYFKDSYLKNPLHESTDPYRFFSWIFEDSFGFDSIRNLIQWELLTVKRKVEIGSEVTVSEYTEIIKIDPLTDTNSLQSYFAKTNFEHKFELVSVVSEEKFIERTVESRTEIVREPVIAAFQLPRSLDSWPESPRIFTVEPELTLPNGKNYNLVAVILYDPQQLKFSVCLDRHDADSAWWLRLQDDSVQKVSRDSVFVSAAKFGYMVFYLESTANACDSPKPSIELIIESLSKNTIHGINKTIQRQFSSNSSPSSILKSGAHFSQKSKNMPLDWHADFALNLMGENSPAGTHRSTSLLSLPSLPSKTPPPIEFEQLQAILVPRDLSNTKLRLITTGSFHQDEEYAADGFDTAKTDKMYSEDVRKARASSSFDDYGFGLYSETSDGNSPDANENTNTQDTNEVYFEYYEGSPVKSNTASSTWATHYLNQEREVPQIRRNSDAVPNFMDFDFEFATEEPKKTPSSEKESTFDEEEAAIRFLEASLAHIKKSQHTDNDHRNIELKQINPKEQTKQYSSKFMSAHNILAHGLFYRSPRTVLPVSSSDDSLSKSEDTDSYPQLKQKEQNDKNDSKKSRYGTF